jgi:hypothetical protein
MKRLRECWFRFWGRRNLPPPPPPEAIPPEALPRSQFDVLALPGHGKTSFIWSSIYLLRKLGLVWPGYVCWSQEEGCEQKIRFVEQQMGQGFWPTSTEALEEQAKYDLRLTSMERWGDRCWTVCDRRDPIFGTPTEAEERATKDEEIRWTDPVLWLLSLSDLGSSLAAPIDSLFDDLVRAREAIGFERPPLKVILTLTKADRIVDLPKGLRDYLKSDPLAHLVGLESQLRVQGIGPDHERVHFSEGSRAKPGPLSFYLQGLHQVHEDLEVWLGRSLSGRLLLQRAKAQHVDLRLCLCSATGSDLRDADRLSLGWQPRRVLDASFWAFERTSLVARS